MMKPSQAELEVLLDAEALAQAAAAWLAELAQSRDGRVAIALAGGSTPKRFYELLAEPPFRDKFPWSRTHWFWGDERFAPHDDPRSNYLMTKKALLSRAPVPQANIHPIPTEGLSPQAAAEAYERELKSFYGAEALDPSRPLFDAVILGLGDNGHTASLMPGSSALDERRRWARERHSTVLDLLVVSPVHPRKRHPQRKTDGNVRPVDSPNQSPHLLSPPLYVAHASLLR